MNIGRLRLANQHVSRPSVDDPAAVVQWLGAVQAQDYLGALWAVGLRTRGATEATVEDAIARGAIVRTWPMRGTLHFVAAPDVRWMTTLLAPRVIAASAGRYRQLELDDAVFARGARVAERALEGGRRLRREAMYSVWNAAGIATGGSRGLHLLGHLSQKGLLCFGPRDGKQQTFALLEEWVPAARSMDRGAALGELARRYFASHGPATVHDFAWWSGLTIADVRVGLEEAKAQLEQEAVGGRTYWFASAPAARAGARAADFLPAWDEYTVAYRDRSDILDPAHTLRVNAGGGVLKPVVVVGGRVVGTWKRAFRKESVVITPAPFARLVRPEVDALEVAAQRYGRFLGMRAEVESPRSPSSRA